MNAPSLPPAVGLARVARLATTDGSRPHVVPVVFCELDGAIYIPIDGKPKSGRRLRRLANIAANPAVALLVDDYFEDWSRLRWTRIDGDAEVVASGAEVVAALRAKYPQYRQFEVGTTAIRVTIRRLRSWSASGPDNP